MRPILWRMVLVSDLSDTCQKMCVYANRVSTKCTCQRITLLGLLSSIFFKYGVVPSIIPFCCSIAGWIWIQNFKAHNVEYENTRTCVLFSFAAGSVRKRYRYLHIVCIFALEQSSHLMLLVLNENWCVWETVWHFVHSHTFELFVTLACTK